MLFRKKLFKRSNQYLPLPKTDVSTPKIEKGKKSKISDKTVQVLKMCHTVKSTSGCIRVFHGTQQQSYETVCADQPIRTPEPRSEICALKKAKLACLEINNVTLPKTCAQLYIERTDKRIRSQNFRNTQFDHPAFQSSLFSGASKKENMNRNERNRRFGEFKLNKIRSLKILQSIQECEDEHLYES